MSSLDKENNMSSKGKEIKDITEICGEIGLFNFIILGMCILTALIANWNVVGYAFLAFPVDHWCAQPAQFRNMTMDQWKNISIPSTLVKGKRIISRCTMYDLTNFTDAEELLMKKRKNVACWTPSDKTVNCESWEFDRSFWSSSIIDQFYLVCSRSYLASVSQAVYMAGFFVSVFVFGQVGDRIGRKPVVLICTGLTQVACFVLPFSNTVVFYSIIRFFVAMGAHGVYTTAFVIMVEYSSAKYRTLYSVGMTFGWAIGFVSLPGIGWLTRDWFTFQLTIAFVTLLYFLYWWLMPESARWLISQGRYDEAKRYIEKAASLNRKWTQDTPAIIDEYLGRIEMDKKNRNETDKKKATILDCLKTPNMRKKSLTMFYAWFVTSFVYYGLSLNTGSLGGNYFINFAIAGAVEFPAVFIGFLLVQYLGRRVPLSLVLTIAGLCCLGIIPLNEDMVTVRVILAMFGKSGVSIAFLTIYIFSAEIFPTVVRNVGVGTSSTFARFGAILAPFVKELGKATNRSVPLAVYGGLTILGAVLVFALLPETRNKEIPETIEEGEEFGKKKKPTKEINDTVTSSM